MKFEAFAHGRVNLIGEHTDYNGGWVLPTLIPQKVIIRIERRPDRTVHLISDKTSAHHEPERATYELGRETKQDHWSDYFQGATALLQKDGHRIGGFEARILSTVPMGSGVSSSAALEVAFLKVLRSAYDLKLSDVEIAQIGQRIENEFVGARVGIMDQMAASIARAGEALFLDTRDLSFERISLPLESFEMIVINSGITHRFADGGGYNTRRAECEEACHRLEIKELRDFTSADLPRLEALPENVRKRARHVITENERVHLAVKAIRARDLVNLGKLFIESHKSMRDDFEISIPEIDALVELCTKNQDVFGARLTGGGFGGSIVAITKPRRGADVAQNVIRAYEARYPESKASLLF